MISLKQVSRAKLISVVDSRHGNLYLEYRCNDEGVRLGIQLRWMIEDVRGSE